MPYTWFDVMLIVVAAAAAVLGLIRGLVREVIGILAALAGLILAAHYYPNVSRILAGLIDHRQTRDFLSFGFIFAVLVVVGALLARFISRRISGTSKLFDHLFGGVAGFLKGVFFCGVIVLGFTVFPSNTNVVFKSRLAPVVLRVTGALIQVVPRELKEKFKESYKRIIRIKEGGSDGQKT